MKGVDSAPGWLFEDPAQPVDASTRDVRHQGPDRPPLLAAQLQLVTRQVGQPLHQAVVDPLPALVQRAHPVAHGWQLSAARS